jgi:hypothetical protein
MKFLFSRLKEFSRHSLDNLRVYINFMEVKMRQEIESLRHLDALESVSEEDPSLAELSIDEKVILWKIRESSLDRREDRKEFYAVIKEEYRRLLECWRKSTSGEIQ